MPKERKSRSRSIVPFTRKSSRFPQSLPASKTTINALPAELLLEIFDYLPPSDIISISETSSRFSALINNTKLTDKLTLQLDEGLQKRDWIGSRTYSKVMIKTEKGVFGILKAIGDDIKELTISIETPIPLLNLAKLINQCHFLKTLTILKVNPLLSLDALSELPFNEDLHVIIEESSSDVLELLRYMRGCKVTVFLLSQGHLINSRGCFQKGVLRMLRDAPDEEGE